MELVISLLREVLSFFMMVSSFFQATDEKRKHFIRSWGTEAIDHGTVPLETGNGLFVWELKLSFKKAKMILYTFINSTVIEIFSKSLVNPAYLVPLFPTLLNYCIILAKVSETASSLFSPFLSL